MNEVPLPVFGRLCVCVCIGHISRCILTIICNIIVCFDVLLHMYRMLSTKKV